jgi:hypothetical protein
VIVSKLNSRSVATSEFGFGRNEMEASGVKSGLDLRANLESPNTDVEQRVVDCFEVLKVAELNFREGVEFGNAAIALRAERKPQKDWMARLEKLGVSYKKARYWISVVERKTTQGSKAAKPEEPFDWDAAMDDLEALKNKVVMLKKSKPLGGGKLVGPLTSLADVLDCKVVSKGGHTA